jgi:uncharacterized membrane protein HdeD (DUF308 family)
MSSGSEHSVGPSSSHAPLSGGPVVIAPGAIERVLRHELHHMRKHWWWFLLLGVLLVVCGTVAFIFPVVGSAAAIDVLSILLLIAGAATIVGAFWAGKWSGMLLQLLVGLLYLAAGFVVTERPVQALVTITIFLAVSFIVMGAFRILAALLYQFPQWGWALLNGVVTMLLGIIIFRHLPFSALWVIGLLIGIEMLFNGWTWIMLSMALRNLPETPEHVK